jgi:uncharacterized LabA/DUF88 family protein
MDAHLFIDAGYLMRFTETLPRYNMSYFIKHIEKITRCKILKIKYYNGQIQGKELQEKQDKFIFSIKKLLPNFELREGCTRQKGLDELGNPIWQQMGVDILLAIDVIKTLYEESNINHIIIVSGDGDFIPLLDAIHHMKKLSVVIDLSQPNINNNLKDLASTYETIESRDFAMWKL